MPKVYAISDLHGHLPEIPECDILLVGGDVCPILSHAPHHQRNFLKGEFTDWLHSIEAKYIVGIGGNHDFVLEKEPWVAHSLPWIYLNNETTVLEGLWIYGTPWVPNLPTWAFYGGNNDTCEKCIDSIPSVTDIVLSHGPMYGYADRVGPKFGGPKPVGCRAMAKRIAEVRPKAFVCGHIHEGHGHYRHPDIEYGVYSVAHMTEHYMPVNPPVELVDFTYA